MYTVIVHGTCVGRTKAATYCHLQVCITRLPPDWKRSFFCCVYCFQVFFLLILNILHMCACLSFIYVRAFLSLGWFQERIWAWFTIDLKYICIDYMSLYLIHCTLYMYVSCCF